MVKISSYGFTVINNHVKELVAGDESIIMIIKLSQGTKRNEKEYVDSRDCHKSILRNVMYLSK